MIQIKHRLTLFLLLCLFPFLKKAQVAELNRHRQMADTFQACFNQKAFNAIYQHTSFKFRQLYSVEAFKDLMQKGLYNTLGTITSLEMLRKADTFYVFLLGFGTAKAKMNLSVNTSFEIDYLNFEPYRLSKAGRHGNSLSDNKLITALDSAVDKAVKSYVQSPQNCGLSLAVNYRGRTVFYNYGEIKYDSRKLPNQHTIYQIGTISSTFCGLLLANALAEGKINANDDVRLYLPGKYSNLVYNNQAVLVKHLANNTSGLPDVPDNLERQPDYDARNPFKNYSRALLLEYLRSAKPTNEPGLVCNYSAVGNALLGVILEKVYKQTFETLVKEKIGAGLGFQNTGVNLSSEQLNCLTDAYDLDGEPTLHWDFGAFVSAGGLRSTSSDLSRYLNYFLTRNDSACRLAKRYFFKEKEKMQLGWMVTKTKAGHTLIWQNSSTFGSSGFCGFIKEKDSGLVILSNSATNVDYIGIAILNYLQQ